MSEQQQDDIGELIDDLQANKTELDQLNQQFREMAVEDESSLMEELERMTAESDKDSHLLQQQQLQREEADRFRDQMELDRKLEEWEQKSSPPQVLADTVKTKKN